MKRFSSILATVLMTASLFLSSPVTVSGDDGLTKYIHLKKTYPTTRSMTNLPEASIQRETLTVSFDGSGMYSLYIEDHFGIRK